MRLDLEIETNPLESKFSAALLDLMQREEQSTAQGRGGSEPHELLCRRVDQLLRTETVRHCELQAQANSQRWEQLLRRQVEERASFRQQCLSAVGAVVDAGVALNRRDLSLEEAFALEERRLKRDAFKNFARYENFNLDNAFGLQHKRVEAEWGVYELQMLEDYETQRAAILGTAPRARGAAAQEEQAKGPWKSKEKQSKLFNTAPVFSPDSGMEKQKTAKMTQAMEVQMANLDRMFAQAKEKIDVQKQNAVRWINRQEARMKIQVEAIDKDRQLITPYLLKADEDFDKFFRQVELIALERRAVVAGSSPVISMAGLEGGVAQLAVQGGERGTGGGGVKNLGVSLNRQLFVSH
jgi:hypothetical protein